MKQEKFEDLWVKPLFSVGRQLQLVALDMSHLNDLEKNLLGAKTWHCVHWQMRTRESLEKAIATSFQLRQAGIGNSVAMVIRSTGEVVGLSRFMAFDRKHQLIEIGGTWIGERWQKTFVNTEAKFLMLSHAFEVIQCQRVEFRVDALNFNSQKAVLRLGAKYEGELRNIARLPDGRKRDYKVYSILDSEWPNIKMTLNWYLEKYV